MMKIRMMTAEDIDDVLQVEQLSFPAPWTREMFVFEMTENEHAAYLVGELDDQIIAYCGAWFVVDQATITNIAVLPAFRGRKFGEQMMLTMLDLARGNFIENISLEVRVSNETAQNLYRKLGFQSGGIRKRYYVDNNEDALVMWAQIGDSN